MKDFVCPKCKSKLITDDNFTKRCENGHTFDRAKQGYYNLLLGKAGGVHGDNKEMVLARREFLSRDFYKPMAYRVAKNVLDYTEKCGVVLDSGCGEGYYTDIVEKALQDRDGETNILAFDISKDAAKNCKKRNQNISVAVASSYDMPIEDASCDTVINIFSPLALEEVKRVLKKQGKFIMVFPNENHLFELKSAIYKTPYKNKPENPDIEGLKLIHKENIDYTITLKTKEEIASLFMMTPYAYRTSKEDRERVLSLEKLDTGVSFLLFVYEKV